MLDDLRNSSTFIDDEETSSEETTQVERRPVRRKQKEQRFLGLTPVQRFVVSLILFFIVCLLGVAALVISGSLALPL